VQAMQRWSTVNEWWH